MQQILVDSVVSDSMGKAHSVILKLQLICSLVNIKKVIKKIPSVTSSCLLNTLTMKTEFGEGMKKF